MKIQLLLSLVVLLGCQVQESQVQVAASPQHSALAFSYLPVAGLEPVPERFQGMYTLTGWDGSLNMLRSGEAAKGSKFYAEVKEVTDRLLKSVGEDDQGAGGARDTTHVFSAGEFEGLLLVSQFPANTKINANIFGNELFSVTGEFKRALSSEEITKLIALLKSIRMSD